MGTSSHNRQQDFWRCPPTLLRPKFSLARLHPFAYILNRITGHVYLRLHYHYTPFRGKKSSSRPSVDTFKASYIQCRRGLLHFSLSTSGLTISASTHLRNLYISKKIPSQCRYQIAIRAHGYREQGHVFPPHPTTIISDSDVEDTFSSTHSPDYIPASPDYFPASPGNTSPNFSLALSPFYDDPYMKVMQAYDATDNELPIPPQAPIAPPTILPPSPISPPKDAETPVESPIPISPSSSVGSSSPVRSTIPPPDYPFDKSIFAELDNSLWIIPQPLGSEPVPEKPNESDAC
ncbi:hypothetical protein Tco_0173039 [Tanacetum coccineum]